MEKNTLDELFKELVFERSDIDTVDETPEYQEANKKAYQLYKELEGKLSDDLKDILLELEAAINYREYLYSAMVYRRGLADGLRLPQLILPMASRHEDSKNTFAVV